MRANLAFLFFLPRILSVVERVTREIGAVWNGTYRHTRHPLNGDAVVHRDDPATVDV